MTIITDIATRQRKQVLAEDAKNLTALSRAYAAMYDRLGGDIDALTAEIDKLDSKTAAAIKGLPEYKRLVRHAKTELDKFTIYTETVIGTAGLAGIALGIAHSRQLINTMAGGSFKGIQPGVMPKLLEYLKTDGPLYDRLHALTGETVDNVVQQIITGVSTGKNPRFIAADIQDAFGRGLTDALRNVRTVQIKSYQDSARANYIATDGIVTGWVWMANLGGNPCASCIAQHGTIHDLEETLDDHYNGECAPLPYIPEFGNPIEQSGKDWFDGLSAEQQAEILGKDKHAAYQDGKFEFSQLSKQGPNDIYGTMRTVASLKDLIGDE
jgi:hypothetical protein